jgi:hypothetical protein
MASWESTGIIHPKYLSRKENRAIFAATVLEAVPDGPHKFFIAAPLRFLQQ